MNLEKEFERGDVIIAKWGYNDVLKKPFEFLFEFGYYTKYGAVVYKQGCCNMQDSLAFELTQINEATEEDLKERFYY